MPLSQLHLRSRLVLPSLPQQAGLARVDHLRLQDLLHSQLAFLHSSPKEEHLHRASSLASPHNPPKATRAYILTGCPGLVSRCMYHCNTISTQASAVESTLTLFSASSAASLRSFASRHLRLTVSGVSPVARSMTGR